MRSFDEWWNTIPSDLARKSRKGDEPNKPLLNQVNYALLHLHRSGKHGAKPSHEELKNWLQWSSRYNKNEQLVNKQGKSALLMSLSKNMNWIKRILHFLN